MRSITVPPLVEPKAHGNISDLPFANAAREPDRVAFLRHIGSEWTDVTNAAFADDVLALAKGLVAAGIDVGDRVALMSRTRYEWTLTDFAVWAAGAVPVPIYETSSAEQVSWILSDAGCAAVVVETPAHSATVAGIRDSLPALRDVWQIDAGALDELVSAGAEVADQDVHDRRGRVQRSDTATIIYTSGTTGRPKGCLLTHDNFMALCENTAERLASVVRAPGATTLLFLPLAHVLARFIEVLCVAANVRVGHSPNIKNLLADLAAVQPTFVLAVPRVFEKIYNSAEAKADADGKGKIFRAAADSAVAWSMALDAGKPGPWVNLKHAVFDRLVFGKLRATMGGKVVYAVSGGAPLGPRLGHFYRGVGLTILEGYGLTETTAPAAVNTPELIKIGTVGPPLPGVAIAVEDDGEILIKGCSVFSRYWNNPAATDEALQHGWFRTGDIGELDDDGYLKITGRKKEIIVTAGGKNVAPAVLEDLLRAHPLVSQCLVVGDQRPFIAVLVTLDAEMLPGWAKNNDLVGLTMTDALTHTAVLAAIQQGVDKANTAVSQAESIRKFVILADDFTEENGYLTPSLKVKRGLVVKDFEADIDALYAAPRH